MGGTTSINTILLVDVEVGVLIPIYMYQSHREKTQKIIIGSSSLENPNVVN